MKVLVSMSMAHTRKTALIHIGSMKSPLSDVIMQLYLWGDSQSEPHWRKELRSIVKTIDDNTEVKKGKLKKKDIIEALDNIASTSIVDRSYASMLKHPDYVNLRTLRNIPPTSEQLTKLLSLLADQVLLKTLSDWDITDQLIAEIDSW